MSRQRRDVGLGIVGTGKIGMQRARLAAQHPAVDFVGLMDADKTKAVGIAEDLGADLVTDTVAELVTDDRIDAIVISTDEPHHTEPALAAIETGKQVLIEKPLALTLEDGDRILQAATEANVDVRVGYSMRYLQKYSVGWDNVASGKVGNVVGMTGRVYGSRAQGLLILERSAEATPVLDIVTYLVDVACWYLSSQVPVEVVSRGHGTVFRDNGFDVDDVAWSMIRFSDGTVVDLGVCYMLPMSFPTTGQSIRFEVFGTDGVLLIDDDHRDQMLYSELGYKNTYNPNQEMNFAFLGSRTTGEWVGEQMFGRLANETRAWVDHLVTGSDCYLTTVAEARTVLAVTLAIEESLTTGEAVKIDHSPTGR